MSAQQVSDKKLISLRWRKILLGDGTSKCNKLWIAIGLQSQGYWLEWKWNPGQLTGFAEPVRFQFEPTGKWFDSKSYDEKYQSMRDNTKKK